MGLREFLQELEDGDCEANDYADRQQKDHQTVGERTKHFKR